ncbi:MAG: protein kinase [Polyangiaceae bacterium]|nr:protein kinase [Polyangiaceae bacterium]
MPASLQQQNLSCPQCGTECSLETRYCPACGFPVGDLQRSGDDPFIGTTLAAGYHITELIGIGGMGRVYRAEQRVLGRTVAVKLIHPHLLADDSSPARFLTEARAASQLNHPNSISVFDFGRTDDGHPYLVMELLRGKDLAQVLHENGPLELPRIVEVLTQVLAALGEAHELGIVHRDLKPENIVLQPLRRGGDLVKVLDFGLAKLKADTPETGVTNPGIVCGTPDYMSPEQGRGDELDGRSDLYAVGVILFQLLTGQLPFVGESPTQVVMMHLTTPPPDPQQVLPHGSFPPAIIQVVRRALTKKSSGRFQDAHEFSTALKNALDGSAIKSSKPLQSNAAPSLIRGETLECEVCSYTVPAARFCCECAAPLPQEPGQLFPIPFLGRGEETSWLASRRPVTAQVQGARIVGEPGVGKTRLLEEYAQVATAQGDQVLFVETDPWAARVSCFALSNAISQLAQVDAETKKFEGATPDAQAGLADLFQGTSANDQRLPMERRHCLAQALRWALQVASKRGPGMPILILDGMARMDSPSLHAFADILGDPPSVQALFIAAHSPGFEPGWGAERTAARRLEGLPRSELRSLPRQPSLIGAESLILPLLLDQTMRYEQEGNQEPPERIGDLIAARIDLLEGEARRVLQGIAILGMSAPVSDVAELIQVDGVSEPIQQLVNRGMITLATSRATISHPLLRHVLVAAIPIEARRKLHRRALRMAERRRAPLEARAYHAVEARLSFQALLLLEQLADRATAIDSTAAEIAALRQGVEIAREELARGELDDPMRAVLIFSRKLGASLTRAGDFADADGILREALGLAGPTSTDRAKILGALAHVSYRRKRYDEALHRLEDGIRVARQAKDPELEENLNDTKLAWSR